MKYKTRTLQKLLSDARRAVADFDMIRDNDKIVVGVSGGKDSLTLLAVLSAYRRFSPQAFELSAVTIDMGFPGADFSGILAYSESLGVSHKIIKTDIAEILFEKRKEKNPCSLCSKIRRGALNSAVLDMGYNKLALGHHADDLVETMLLSLFYEGRLSTFQPVSFMDRTGITMIRPLIYIYERDIVSFSEGLPVLFNPCPADRHTQREYMKDLIKNLQKDIPFAFDRMHSAIVNPERYRLFPKKTGNAENPEKAENL